MTTPDDQNPFANAPIIFRYTRAQALEAHEQHTGVLFLHPILEKVSASLVIPLLEAELLLALTQKVLDGHVNLVSWFDGCKVSGHGIFQIESETLDHGAKPYVA